jgi:hypothetical protein
MYLFLSVYFNAIALSVMYQILCQGKKWGTPLNSFISSTRREWMFEVAEVKAGLL